MATIAQLIADGDGWGHMSGWGWGWMIVGWLALIAVVAMIVWSVNRPAGGAQSARPDPEDILAERFARGELSIEEFHERRAALRGNERS